MIFVQERYAPLESALPWEYVMPRSFEESRNRGQKRAKHTVIANETEKSIGLIPVRGFPEIAEILGIPRSTVQHIYQQALAKVIAKAGRMAR
jgi:hypothetical protein